MNYESIIRREIEWQREWYKANPKGQPNITASDPIHRMPIDQWRDMADEDRGYIPKLSENLPHAILAKTSDELSVIYAAFMKVSGDSSPNKRRICRETVRHEKEHGEIATLLTGRKIPFFHVLFLMNRAGNNYNVKTTTRISDVSVSKLEVALFKSNPRDIATAPDGDLMDIQIMGYDDAFDVARHIKEHNKRYPRNKLPLPLSARW